MDYQRTSLGQLDFQRNRDSRGCGCCFMFAGLIALPFMGAIGAIVATLVAA